MGEQAATHQSKMSKISGYVFQIFPSVGALLN
jgi:hypothetical protein